MRNNLILPSFLLVLFNLASGQTDTTTFLQYFPLNDGDIWQYECRYYEHSWDTVEVVTYFTKEVKGDTILPNGLCYKKVFYDESGWGHFRFFRVDTSSLKVYEYAPGTGCDRGEMDFLYLSGLVDSTLQINNCHGTVSEVTLSSDSLLEVATVWAVEEHYTLQRNIGIISYSAWEAGPPWMETLLAANIKGVQTGNFLAINSPLANEFSLLRTFPNPFNPSLMIQYSLEQSDPVKVAIYNLAGQLVEMLINERQTPGNYQIHWNGIDQPSGIYLIRLSVAGISHTSKVLLLK